MATQSLTHTMSYETKTAIEFGFDFVPHVYLMYCNLLSVGQAGGKRGEIFSPLSRATMKNRHFWKFRTTVN